MSCNVLLDINDSTSSYQSNHADKGIAGVRQNIVKSLTYLGRVLYFRRLRLLKFYMALAVLLIILFCLLKFSPTHTQEHPNPIESRYSSESRKTTNSDGINDLKIVQPQQRTSTATIDGPTVIRGNTNPGFVLPFTKQALYPKNVSYLLSIDDFMQMKNVNVMQVRIREALKHSWNSYRRYAWGYDMLKPRAKEPDHWFNLGLTIVDGADSLMMLGLSNDANLAIDWLENGLTFNSTNENSNCFEMTIRILGGILSAYHLTRREKLKHQAIEMGNILMHCYDTESRIIPYSDIDLKTRRSHPPPWNPHSSLSEVASLQLEFRHLSQISGNPEYERTTFQTSIHIHNLTSTRRHKLLPMYINPTTGLLEDSIITLGARSDSYYEYLLKQYLQTGIKWLEDDYLDSVDEMGALLFRHTDGIDNYTYVAEMQIFRTVNDTDEFRYHNKMDHLVCFLPGTLALGFYHFSPLASEYRLKYNLETQTEKLNARYDNHLTMSKALARTCYHMYKNMGTGLSPEIATFVHATQSDNPAAQNQPELQVQAMSAHNILRPEYVESLFYLYHITGLPTYRDQAAQIFEAFQKYARIDSGYSPISDVRNKPDNGANLDELLHQHAPDRMESFWISETLKYLYLTFCDDRHIVGTLLNNYIFNTEAHMLPIL